MFLGTCTMLIASFICGIHHSFTETLQIIRIHYNAWNIFDVQSSIVKSIKNILKMLYYLKWIETDMFNGNECTIMCPIKNDMFIIYNSIT